jgi:carbamoyl-phosphate synthase L subunit-like protein
VTVLILHLRGSLKDAPYDRWLADYDGDLILLASREHMELLGEELPTEHGYLVAEAVSGYQASGAVEARVLELAREHGVEHVIAPQEQDLERAARLREILGLPGQRVDSVEPYRDKILMKETVRAAGVPVATYRDVETAVDLVAFAEEHGFPIVVKPRDGAGSFGVRILRSREALHEFLTTGIELYGPFQSNLMVEKFVSETMCHVDGLVVDGRVVYLWPSRYLYALAVYENDRGGRMDVTLDADDPLTARLVELTEKVIGALPSPPDFAFHAEIFHTPDDELVLGEIGCRFGGAAQRPIQRELFGLDPAECAIRAQIGLPLPVEPGKRLRPKTLTGQLALLKRPGRVLGLPGEAPFPWVVRTQLFVRPGDVMGPPAFAADFMVMWVITAPTRAESVRRMGQLERWFLDHLELGEAGGPARRREVDYAGMTEGTGRGR